MSRSGKRLSKLKLRNQVMQSDLPEWVKETPCHIPGPFHSRFKNAIGKS
ncbi:hypothetical protein VB834_05000 [Limnoraphis robusta Tam1]|nr:hypothetical protein [Limnoraphis robusta]MEA5538387.1 hypothetical protein [Limnoraphis robusta Tam1]